MHVKPFYDHFLTIEVLKGASWDNIMENFFNGLITYQIKQMFQENIEDISVYSYYHQLELQRELTILDKQISEL